MFVSFYTILKQRLNIFWNSTPTNFSYEAPLLKCTFCSSLHNISGAGIVLSVQRLVMGWMTDGSVFESLYGQEFSLFHVFQSGSGAHPIGTGGSCPGGKATGA
jgi:polyferredoxin